MICRPDLRRFDGDTASTLHASVWPRRVIGLRFIAWVTIDKGTGRYAGAADAPSFEIAWIPAERVRDETSSPAEIDAALADPDQVPLLVEQRRPVAYFSDAGSPFPCVGIQGKPMVLAVRLETIVAGTHGQLTFGWRTQS